MNTNTLQIYLAYCCYLLITMFSSVTAFAQEPSALISAQELQAVMNQQIVKIIDVRNLTDYSKEHIPTALQIARADYNAPPPAIIHTLPSKQQFEAALSRMGITPKDHLVLYDNNRGMDAARLWWLLAVFGHTNVSLLDGGITGWKSEGYQVATGVEQISPSHYMAQPENKKLIGTVEDCLTPHGNTVLVDTRSNDEFKGITVLKGSGSGGHIPGAINLDWLDLIDKSTKKSIPINEIKKMFAAKGITPNSALVIYCQSGVRAAYVAFIASQVLHYPSVKVYDGSWHEWSNISSLPVASDY